MGPLYLAGFPPLARQQPMDPRSIYALLGTNEGSPQAPSRPRTVLSEVLGPTYEQGALVGILPTHSSSAGEVVDKLLGSTTTTTTTPRIREVGKIPTRAPLRYNLEESGVVSPFESVHRMLGKRTTTTTSSSKLSEAVEMIGPQQRLREREPIPSGPSHSLEHPSPAMVQAANEEMSRAVNSLIFNRTMTASQKADSLAAVMSGHVPESMRGNLARLCLSWLVNNRKTIVLNLCLMTAGALSFSILAPLLGVDSGTSLLELVGGTSKAIGTFLVSCLATAIRGLGVAMAVNSGVFMLRMNRRANAMLDANLMDAIPAIKRIMDGIRAPNAWKVLTVERMMMALFNHGLLYWSSRTWTELALGEAISWSVYYAPRAMAAAPSAPRAARDAMMIVLEYLKDVPELLIGSATEEESDQGSATQEALEEATPSEGVLQFASRSIRSLERDMGNPRVVGTMERLIERTANSVDEKLTKRLESITLDQETTRVLHHRRQAPPEVVSERVVADCWMGYASMTRHAAMLSAAVIASVLLSRYSGSAPVQEVLSSVTAMMPPGFARAVEAMGTLVGNVSESEYAKMAFYRAVVGHMGISKLIEKMKGMVAEPNLEVLRSIDARMTLIGSSITRERERGTLVGIFFDILLGKKFHTKGELQGMSTHELRAAARVYSGADPPPSATRSEMVRYVLQAQAQAATTIHRLIFDSVVEHTLAAGASKVLANTVPSLWRGSQQVVSAVLDNAAIISSAGLDAFEVKNIRSAIETGADTIGLTRLGGIGPQARAWAMSGGAAWGAVVSGMDKLNAYLIGTRTDEKVEVRNPDQGPLVDPVASLAQRIESLTVGSGYQEGEEGFVLGPTSPLVKLGDPDASAREMGYPDRATMLVELERRRAIRDAAVAEADAERSRTAAIRRDFTRRISEAAPMITKPSSQAQQPPSQLPPAATVEVVDDPALARRVADRAKRDLEIRDSVFAEQERDLVEQLRERPELEILGKFIKEIQANRRALGDIQMWPPGSFSSPGDILDLPEMKGWIPSTMTPLAIQILEGKLLTVAQDMVSALEETTSLSSLVNWNGYVDTTRSVALLNNLFGALVRSNAYTRSWAIAKYVPILGNPPIHRVDGIDHRLDDLLSSNVVLHRMYHSADISPEAVIAEVLWKHLFYGTSNAAVVAEIASKLSFGETGHSVVSSALSAVAQAGSWVASLPKKSAESIIEIPRFIHDVAEHFPVSV